MELPKCDVCGEDVTIEEGLISISLKKTLEVQEKREDFKKKYPGPILHVGDVVTFPPSVPWVWHHNTCNSDGSYSIEATRFDDLRKALHWTIHLQGKTWFKDTNWRNVIHRFYPECD
jgi:hypothetical protein